MTSRSIKTATIQLAKASYFKFALSLAAQLFVTRILTPNEFGCYALSVAIVESCFILQVYASNRACMVKSFNTQVYHDCFYASIILSAVCSCLSILTCHAIQILLPNIITDAKLLLNLCLFQTVTRSIAAVASIAESFYESIFDYKPITRLISVGGAVAILMMIATVSSLGVYSLAIRDIALASTSMLFLNKPIRAWLLQRPTLSELGYLYKYGNRQLLERLSEILQERLPTLISSTLFGITTAGFIERVSYFSNLPNTFLQPVLHRVSFATLTNDEISAVKKRKIFVLNLAVSSMVSIMLLVLLLATPRQVVHILLGQQWIPYQNYLPLISFWIAIKPIYLTLVMKALAAVGPAQVALCNTINLGGPLMIGVLSQFGIKTSIGSLFGLMSISSLVGTLTLLKVVHRQ